MPKLNLALKGSSINVPFVWEYDLPFNKLLALSFYLDDFLARDTVSLWHVKLWIYEATVIETFCLAILLIFLSSENNF